MGGERLHRPLVGAVDDRADLLVDRLGDVVRVVPLLADLAAEEHELVALPERERAEPVAHAVFGDHPACPVGRLLDVVRRAGGGVAEDQALGGVAREHPGDLVFELGLALEVTILHRQTHRVAQGHTPADDGHLLDRVALGQDPHDDRVTAFVEGDDLLLGVADHPAAPLRSGDDSLERLLELGHADDLLAPPCGQDGRLVDQVGQVGPGEAGGLLGDAFDVDRLVERLALGVDLEDGRSATHVRPVEDDLTVEPTGTQQGRVEHVGAVGRGHYDHVGVRIEAVHLDQDLVEGLLALIVRAAEAGATLAADRVDLVHEDDARAVPLGLVEQVANAAGTDSHKHLDELGARDREERDAGLPGHGPGHQRLAGAGRPDQQDATRDARTERVELLGVLQKLDDFLELGLGLVHAGDVVERHDRLVAEEHPGPALAEAQRLVIGALGLAHHEQDEPDDHDQRQEPRDEDPQPRSVGCRLGGVGVGRERDVARLGGVLHVLQDRRQDVGRNRDRVRRSIGCRDGKRLLLLADRLDLAALDVGEELRVTDGIAWRGAGQPGPQQREGPDDQDQHHDPVACELCVQERKPPGLLRSTGVDTPAVSRL